MAKRYSLLFLKFAFLAAALFYVVHKINAAELWEHIKKSDWRFLLAAFICLHFAAIIGSLRLGVYLDEGKFEVPKLKLLSFFYIGLFFNTILPGGFSGDGYLTLYFKKRFGFAAKSLIRIMLSARANGLFFLNLFLFAFLWMSDYANIFPGLKTIIIILLLLQLPVYILVNKLILKESFKVFLRAGFYSLVSQISSLLSMFFVLKAIGVQAAYVDYLSLFAISMIAAILPITPGGAGVRELVFLKGAIIAGIDPELAVSSSLVYFGIYILTSLTGIVFYLRKPKHIIAEE